MKNSLLPDFSSSNTPLHKQTKKILSFLEQNKIRPKLLLHACCAPCSSYVIEYLSNYFDITIFYYNPNIFPPEEYKRRLCELENFLPGFEIAQKNHIKLVKACYEPQEFYDAIDIKNHPEFAVEKEKGERCKRCYEVRLKKSYLYAKENNFDYLCTTLSISPFKDAQKINLIGKNLCQQFELEENQKGGESQNTNSVNPKWLPSDFKKNGGFERSLELSREYGLYRQQYCGCMFSKQNTERERLAAEEKKLKQENYDRT